MKRTLCILLTVVFALSFASCGKTEEYTYDFLPSEYPKHFSAYRYRSQPIKGGAYLFSYLNNIEGESIAVGESNVPMASLFNEDTKTVMPLCFGASCEHGFENLDCFGNIYGYFMDSFCGIYEDTVFSIRENYKKKNQLEAVYYGLDGIIKETVEYAPVLYLPNGEILENRYMMNIFTGFYMVGSRIYMELVTEDVGTEDWVMMDQSEIKYFHWFVCYNLETKEWSVAASLPYSTYDQFIGFSDVKDNKLAFNNNGVCYVADADTGETEVYDCAEILDAMISDGKVPAGTQIRGGYALRDYFVCDTGREYLYCRISTQEIVDPAELDISAAVVAVAGVSQKFVYNGELYVIDYVATSNKYICTNKNTGEKFSFGIDGKVLSFFSETEKGIIFRYIERLENGNWESDTYTVKENGSDVEYFYPEKYVYVTKEDILDGNIDEPWYYDAETYSFVQE